MALHGRAGYAEPVSDLLDGLLARVVQLLDDLGLVRGEGGLSAANPCCYSASTDRSSVRCFIEPQHGPSRGESDDEHGIHQVQS